MNKNMKMGIAFLVAASLPACNMTPEQWNEFDRAFKTNMRNMQQQMTHINKAPNCNDPYSFKTYKDYQNNCVPISQLYPQDKKQSTSSCPAMNDPRCASPDVVCVCPE